LIIIILFVVKENLFFKVLIDWLFWCFILAGLLDIEEEPSDFLVQIVIVTFVAAKSITFIFVTYATSIN